MAIDKDLLIKLRNASQSGFADCRKALEENNNDLEAAIKWLRERGIAKANNKNALKEAHEGGTWVKKDSRGVAMIELNSETDFTATNSEFIALAERILEAMLSNGVGSEVEQVLKLKVGEMTLLDHCLHLSSITGEKIVLKRCCYIALRSGESASCYRHNNGRMSAILVLDKDLPDEKIRGLSVHYAANNPKFVSRDQVDQDWISEEKKIIATNLQRENKPEQFHERIIEERIKKILSQITFLDQNYLYDDSRTIGSLLEEWGAKIKQAIYYEVGAD